MPRANRRKAKEAEAQNERETAETVSRGPGPGLAGLELRNAELPPPASGWSRYFDPQHGTYLYHEATGDWHLEEARVEEVAQSWPELGQLGASEVKELHGGAKKGPTAIKESAKQAARPPASKRPPVPPIPSEGTGSSQPSAPLGGGEPSASGNLPAGEALASEPCSTNGGGSVSDAGTARPKVVSELAKLDPIVRDFVRDEFRLKKKLREIEALEAAGASGKSLEAAQVAKVSKKGQVLSDLRLVDQHISEALADFQKRQPLPLAPRSSEQQASPGARSSGSSKDARVTGKAHGGRGAATNIGRAGYTAREDEFW